MSKPKPKTLIEVLTQEGLLDDPDVVVVCECHRLTHCPTAWMHPDGAEEGKPLVAEMRLDLKDFE